MSSVCLDVDIRKCDFYQCVVCILLNFFTLFTELKHAFTLLNASTDVSMQRARVCLYFLNVCLTKLSVSATVRDTDLGVAACQPLLSYRHTQRYNNGSGAARPTLSAGGQEDCSGELLTAGTPTSHSLKLIKHATERRRLRTTPADPAGCQHATTVQEKQTHKAEDDTQTCVFMLRRKQWDATAASPADGKLSYLASRHSHRDTDPTSPDHITVNTGLLRTGGASHRTSTGDTLSASQGTNLWKQTVGGSFSTGRSGFENGSEDTQTRPRAKRKRKREPPNAAEEKFRF